MHKRDFSGSNRLLLLSAFARIGLSGDRQPDTPEPALTAPCPAPQR